mmetsp:Transcript_6205/g.22829  ORF Transcript_6205/g.22829 Transcript_6205/m.22829 type:complete len:112 (-) Transcript_6205:222-557(-)
MPASWLPGGLASALYEGWMKAAPFAAAAVDPALAAAALRMLLRRLLLLLSMPSKVLRRLAIEAESRSTMCMQRKGDPAWQELALEHADRHDVLVSSSASGTTRWAFTQQLQ